MGSETCMLSFLLFYLVFIVEARHDGVVLYDEADPEVWCKFQPNGYDCKENGIYRRHYYFDIKLQDCKWFDFGSCEHNNNKFNSLKQCRRECVEEGPTPLHGQISYLTYCKMQPDFGNCNDYQPSFYFDLTTRTCKGFSYSGCGGNPNRFRTAQQCITVCNEFMNLPSETDT